MLSPGAVLLIIGTAGHAACELLAVTAAHRAVITITADHPPRGDAWVVHTVARCGNVVSASAAVRQQVRAFYTNAERRPP